MAMYVLNTFALNQIIYHSTCAINLCAASGLRLVEPSPLYTMSYILTFVCLYICILYHTHHIENFCHNQCSLSCCFTCMFKPEEGWPCKVITNGVTLCVYVILFQSAHHSMLKQAWLSLWNLAYCKNQSVLLWFCLLTNASCTSYW